MLGAVIGDIIGSYYEWHNVKTKDFDLFPKEASFTDDTVMTLAVARWLIEDKRHTKSALVKIMLQMGRKYLNAGYGGQFYRWLLSDKPVPYNSWGNGSAMRVSPVGLYAKSLDEALELAKISACVTHNHPEGIKGAQAIAAAVFINRSDYIPLVERQAKIKNYIQYVFGYNLERTLDEIRPSYKFDESCQGTVPEAIIAFLESNTLQDCVRNAISIGGDSDTIAAIACSIFAAGIGRYSTVDSESELIATRCKSYLDDFLLDIYDRFEKEVKNIEYRNSHSEHFANLPNIEKQQHIKTMYYYINNLNQQCGPVPVSTLRNYGITPETYVWKAGMQNWTRAKAVPELQGILSRPVQYQAANNYQNYSPSYTVCPNNGQNTVNVQTPKRSKSNGMIANFVKMHLRRIIVGVCAIGFSYCLATWAMHDLNASHAGYAIGGVLLAMFAFLFCRFERKVMDFIGL